MYIGINFSADGNASQFIRTGWSGQEEQFIWTLGEFSTLSVPCLMTGDLSIECQITGFDATQALPLRIVVSDIVIAEFWISGTTTIKFQLPALMINVSDPVLKFHHPVHKPYDFEATDNRLLAFCFHYARFTDAVGDIYEDSSKQAILVLGNSHIAALRAASVSMLSTDSAKLARIFAFLTLPPGHFWVRPNQAGIPYDLRLIEEVRQYGKQLPGCILVSTIFGNGHFILGGIKHDIPFDFIEPSRQSEFYRSERTIIPYSLFRLRAHRSTEVLLGILKIFVDDFLLSVIHVSSPPPTADNFILATYVNRTDTRKSAASTNELCVEDPEIRLKTWRLFEDVAKEVVEAAGGLYMPPPSEALDHQGYLLKEFEGDGFHANTKYGNAVLRQLAEFLNRK